MRLVDMLPLKLLRAPRPLTWLALPDLLLVHRRPGSGEQIRNVRPSRSRRERLREKDTVCGRESELSHVRGLFSLGGAREEHRPQQ